MQRLRASIDKALAWALILLMGVAVLNVLWQVFTRYVTQSPSSYTEELARFLLIWIGLLGASYAAGRKLHLAIDLLPMKLEGRPKHYLDLVIEGFVLLFALAVMVVGGLNLVTLTLRLEQTSAALGVKLGYVYMVIPLSGLIIAFYAVLLIIERVQVLRGKAVIVTESDRTAQGPID